MNPAAPPPIGGLGPRYLWKWAGLLLVVALLTAGFLAVSAVTRLGGAIEGLGTWSEQARSERTRAAPASSVDAAAATVPAAALPPTPVASDEQTGTALELATPTVVEDRRSAASDFDAEVFDAEAQADRAELAEILASDPETRAAIQELIDQLEPEEIDEDLEFLLQSVRDSE